MRDFRVAGTASDADEEVLRQVVHIAGYVGLIHRLVSRNFTYCHEHANPLPRRHPPVVRVTPNACGPHCLSGGPPFRGY